MSFCGEIVLKIFVSVDGLCYTRSTTINEIKYYYTEGNVNETRRTCTNFTWSLNVTDCGRRSGDAL
ncbi:hypothetical protein JCM2421_05130 [Staphylococcus auricularis]|nr:hypothetical protein JCM2421_05130 [Staphylococcus auricularis]